MVAAMRAVRSIETTVLFNRTRARAEDLAGQLGGNVQVADNANGAVAGADIIVLCTTSPTAVVDDRAIAAGAHINAVGNFSAQGSELTLETVARCERWVDSYEGAFSEAGEMILAAAAGLIPEGHAGLRGDLAALAAAPDSLRGDADAVTLYKSVGTALADVGALVAAAAVAARHDLGTLLD
jgi:ornithine cyclodeaminase